VRWTISLMSALTRTDQKFVSFARSSLWKERPGAEGSICRSKAVVLAAFRSCAVRRARLSVKVSAMRKSIRGSFVKDTSARDDASYPVGPSRLLAVKDHETTVSAQRAGAIWLVQEFFESLTLNATVTDIYRRTFRYSEPGIYNAICSVVNS
jgi:hypothetical protein